MPIDGILNAVIFHHTNTNDYPYWTIFFMITRWLQGAILIDRRIDCQPDSEPTAESCQARGCLYDGITVVSWNLSIDGSLGWICAAIYDHFRNGHVSIWQLSWPYRLIPLISFFQTECADNSILFAIVGMSISGPDRHSVVLHESWRYRVHCQFRSRGRRDIDEEQRYVIYD